MSYNILLKWTEHRLTTKAEPASLRSFQQFLEFHIYGTINREQTITTIRQQQNNIDNVKDLSVPMAHCNPRSQINNQNLFGNDNSNAVSQPAIKPHITVSNREWSSSVTIFNNTEAIGKQDDNNRYCPHCNNNHFWQLVPTIRQLVPIIKCVTYLIQLKYVGCCDVHCWRAVCTRYLKALSQN